MADSLVGLVALPVALGLLGFVEPCTIGSSLLFVHYLDGRPPAARMRETLVFAGARALLMGLLGAAAVLVGIVFIDLQKAAWAIMGTLYIALGIAYLSGRIEHLKRPLGASLRRLEGPGGATTIGLVFAFNIPACAGPLLATLLGTAAVAEGGNFSRGFLMLGLFGLALSAPIAVAVLSERGRRLLERLSGAARSVPRILGILFVVLGAWSIRFALVAEVL